MVVILGWIVGIVGIVVEDVGVLGEQDDNKTSRMDRITAIRFNGHSLCRNYLYQYYLYHI
jgi:hypothetical protein